MLKTAASTQLHLNILLLPVEFLLPSLPPLSTLLERPHEVRFVCADSMQAAWMADRADEKGVLTYTE